MRITRTASLCSRRYGTLKVPNGTSSAPIWLARRSTSQAAQTKFASFFFNNAHSLPTTARSTAIRLADDASRESAMEVQRGADMSRFPVLLPLPTEAEIATYRPIAPLGVVSTLKLYAQLAKARLTFLVVLTAMSGVALSPLPATVPVLLSTALGTALCATSANAINQLREVPFDAQMARTRMRPLVRLAVTPLHVAAFAAATGIAGPAVLWAFTNPLTAALGAANIVLYAGVYTSLKRRSVVNTWVGAVVGALPPLMGWAACGGALLPSPEHPLLLFPPPFMETLAALPSPLIDNPLAAASLAMLLFSWQFPHFNAFAHGARDAYAMAGYKMLASLSPAQNARVAARYTLLLVPICSVLVPLSGMTTWTFALTSLVPTGLLLRSAVRFWRTRGEKEARRLFLGSLVYLPLILGLMMVHKQGVDWLQWLREEQPPGDQGPVEK